MLRMRLLRLLLRILVLRVLRILLRQVLLLPSGCRGRRWLLALDPVTAGAGEALLIRLRLREVPGTTAASRHCHRWRCGRGIARPLSSGHCACGPLWCLLAEALNLQVHRHAPCLSTAAAINRTCWAALLTPRSAVIQGILNLQGLRWWLWWGRSRLRCNISVVSRRRWWRCRLRRWMRGFVSCPEVGVSWKAMSRRFLA